MVGAFRGVAILAAYQKILAERRRRLPYSMTWSARSSNTTDYRALTAIGSSSTFQPVNLLDPGRPAAVDRCLERA
jgi:hypothetical protein